MRLPSGVRGTRASQAITPVCFYLAGSCHASNYSECAAEVSLKPAVGRFRLQENLTKSKRDWPRLGFGSAGEVRKIPRHTDKGEPNVRLI
jgi:hypothetical protein